MAVGAPGDELKLLRLPQVLELVPVSHMTLYRMIGREEFPAPVKLGRSSAWRYAEIKEWVDGLSPDTPPQPTTTPRRRDDSDI